MDVLSLPTIASIKTVDGPGPKREVEKRCIIKTGEVQLCGRDLVLVRSDKVTVTTYKQKRSAQKAFAVFAQIGRIA